MSHVDQRHIKRQEIIQELFSLSFHSQPTHEEAKRIMLEEKTIDAIIEQIAPEFPIEKINRVDLAILRLAVYEMEVTKTIPPKVAINEAIELAKEYGGEHSPAFVNGALGKLIQKENESHS